MATKKEKENMNKVLVKINNKWEAIAFVWAYRQKEIRTWIIMLETAVIIFFILYYTPLISWIAKIFEKKLG